MSQVNEVGSVELEEIMLYNFDRSKELNILNLVQRVEIYESLRNNTLQADFSIAEGIELLNNFPVNGEEFIELTFNTPGKKSLSFEFFIDSVEGQRSNDTSMQKSYILRCVTEDFLRNSFTKFTKRYTDLGYDEAIQTVIKNQLGSSKSPFTEKTTGKFDYVVNSLRPFQAIDLIAERAVSGEGNKSSIFMFYEDSEGYKFQTLEKLIKDRKGGAEAKQFFYDISNRASDYEKVVNQWNILSYETTTQGSTIGKVKSGAIRTQVHQFDMLHGTYYDKFEYNNQTDHKQFEKTDGSSDFNSGAFNEYAQAMPAYRVMVLKDGTRPEMKHNQNIHWKRPFQERVAQYTVRIRVYGNSDIMVGDVIKLSIPDITGTTKEPEQQEIFSENYIITNLKHRLDKQKDGRFNYFMAFDLNKPNLLKDIG